MATTQASSKRLTKHQLKQDAFTTTIFAAREWITQNLRLAFMVLGGIVAILAIVWGINYYRTSQAAQANSLFGQGGVEIRGGNLAAGIISLRKLVDEHSGATVAGIACVQLADAYFQQRTFDDAKKYFQKYIDSYGNDPTMNAAAWSGLAAIDEQASANAEAAQKFMKAAGFIPKTFQAAEYLRGALRCAFAAKDSALATQIFSTLEKDYGPNDQNVRLARQNMIENKFLEPQVN
ncbi:MAG: tetratricopeptide repeat protein [candidate division Zixibacteria bacterium]|nr:tetratricopeptide repeat protein [candidate division Zixibacteria bacterium]